MRKALLTCDVVLQDYVVNKVCGVVMEYPVSPGSEGSPDQQDPPDPSVRLASRAAAVPEDPSVKAVCRALPGCQVSIFCAERGGILRVTVFSNVARVPKILGYVKIIHNLLCLGNRGEQGGQGSQGLRGQPGQPGTPGTQGTLYSCSSYNDVALFSSDSHHQITSNHHHCDDFDDGHVCFQAIGVHKALKESLGQSVRRVTGVAPDHLANQGLLGQQDR